jgi:hypothetical protein
VTNMQEECRTTSWWKRLGLAASAGDALLFASGLTRPLYDDLRSVAAESQSEDGGLLLRTAAGRSKPEHDARPGRNVCDVADRGSWVETACPLGARGRRFELKSWEGALSQPARVNRMPLSALPSSSTLTACWSCHLAPPPGSIFCSLQRRFWVGGFEVVQSSWLPRADSTCGKLTPFLAFEYGPQGSNGSDPCRHTSRPAAQHECTHPQETAEPRPTNRTSTSALCQRMMRPSPPLPADNCDVELSWPSGPRSFSHRGCPGTIRRCGRPTQGRAFWVRSTRIQR